MISLSMQQSTQAQRRALSEKEFEQVRAGGESEESDEEYEGVVLDEEAVGLC